MTLTLSSAGVKVLIHDNHRLVSLFIGKKINIELLYIIKVPHYKFCAYIVKYSGKSTLNLEVLSVH